MAPATQQDHGSGQADLQAAYSRRRAAWAAGVDALRVAGGFKAPEHLQPPLQAQLLLASEMPVDEIRAEAA